MDYTGSEIMNTVQECRVEQDVRLGEIETRLRTVEDALLSLNLNVEWMSKAARIVVTLLGLSLGIDATPMAGVHF